LIILCTVKFFCRNLFKNGRTRAVLFSPRFWSNFVQAGQNSSHGWFFCADLGEIRPIWKIFGQLGRSSTKIGGGNSTARVRPFLNEFRPQNFPVWNSYRNLQWVETLDLEFRACKCKQNATEISGFHSVTKG
jgi:hypothetical protein